jgi:hypothetical protein
MWSTTPTYDYASAAHDGYARLPQPVRHRRRVLFLKRHGWLVIDDLTGRGDHHAAVRFHLQPRPVTLTASGWLRAEGRAGRGLWLVTLGVGTMISRLRCGQDEPPDGWNSPSYGQRHPSPTLEYSVRGPVPIRFVTLLLPQRALGHEPPPLTFAHNDAGMVTSVQVPNGPLIAIGEDSLAIDGDAVGVSGEPAGIGVPAAHREI